MAANLKGGRSSTVGVMTASGRNPYYAMLVQGIDAVVQRSGLHVRHQRCDARWALRRRTPARVGRGLAAAAGRGDRRHLPAQHRQPGPDQPLGHAAAVRRRLAATRIKGLPFVGCDNLEAGRLVARYLASLGCRRVAVLAYPKEWNTRAPRERGLRDAAPATMAIDLVESDNSAEGAHDAMAAHLRSAQRPDAIYALNTPLLHGAMRAIKAVGLRIPDDISVLGFDDFEWATLLDPPMTVVDQHIDEIGRLAGVAVVDLLADAGNAGDASGAAGRPATPPRHIAVSPTLVIRASCRSVPLTR